VNRLAVPYRVWLIGKSIDYREGGSGVLGTEEILDGCSLYGLNEGHVMRALDAGESQFHSSHDDVVYLKGYQRLSRELEVKKPGRIVEIPAHCIQRIGLFSAHLYAAWLGERQISRCRLTKLFNRTLPTLRKWEKWAKIGCNPTTVQIDFNLVQEMLDFPYRYFWYECRKCGWRARGFNKAGQSLSYLAERHLQRHPVLVVSTLSNFYKSPLPHTWKKGTGRGSLRVVRRAHNAPFRGKPQGAEAAVSASCGAPNSNVGSQGQRRITRAGSLEGALRKIKSSDGPVLAFVEWKGQERRYELLF
jgi:hypothetical protein